MLQYLAQGACMAIEDAVCLADQLDAAGSDVAAAFQTYERQRYLRTARVQIMARVYGEVYHAAGVTAERPPPAGPGAAVRASSGGGATGGSAVSGPADGPGHAGGRGERRSPFPTPPVSQVCASVGARVLTGGQKPTATSSHCGLAWVMKEDCVGTSS